MPVRKKGQAMSNAEKRQRRRDLYAQKKASARQTANYNLMVKMCKMIEPGLQGNDLAARANRLSDQIDLMGWFVVDLDDGVRETAPDKKTAYNLAAGSFVGNPISEKFDTDAYSLRSNYRTVSVRVTNRSVGTWKSL